MQNEARNNALFSGLLIVVRFSLFFSIQFFHLFIILFFITKLSEKYHAFIRWLAVAQLSR